MKISKKILVISIPLLLTSCGSKTSSSINDSFSSFINSESTSETSEISSNSQANSLLSNENPSSSKEINSSSKSDNSSSTSKEISSNKITAGGSYTIDKNLNESIYIEAGEEDTVELILSGITISSNSNSPIYCKCAGELKIKLIGINTINDNRDRLNKDEENPDQGKGAIYSECDLKITGSGSLEINANYNNGLHSKDDIKLKSTGNIKITSTNHAIKGNDSVEIESGNIILISKCGSGIKTENTSISSKGNQKGNIVITGGEISIYSCEDAIEAAHNAIIENNPKITIKTSKYSEYTEGSISSGSAEEIGTKMYFRVGNRNYNYSVEFKNANNELTWVNATYSTSKSGSRGSTYYFYELTKPNDAISMKIYLFNSSTTNRDKDNAITSSSFININNNYDTAVLSVSTTNITCPQWTNFAQQSGPGGWGGMQEGNNDKADYSAKGVKAYNEIIINGGIIDIKAYDDALHATRGTQLENGLVGEGNVHISNGTLTLDASDDGIHADYINEISGGIIDITNSYEGIEGNILNISGGYTKVYSTDDGLNAAKKAGVDPAINISGGIIDITVYGGDVDGIDSNNTYTQTGGLVITKGGTGGMSTGLDTDGACRVNSGTLIVFGKPENTPTLGNGVSSYTLSGTYSIGTYVVSNGVNSVEVSTKYSYSTIYAYSSEQNKYTVTKK